MGDFSASFDLLYLFKMFNLAEKYSVSYYLPNKYFIFTFRYITLDEVLCIIQEDDNNDDGIFIELPESLILTDEYSAETKEKEN